MYCKRTTKRTAEGAARGNRIDALALAAKSDRTATASLVKAVAPMVRNIARIHARRNGEDFDDVFQDATLGLLRAIVKWDPNGGANFLTYAGNWVHALGKRTGMKHSANGTIIRDRNREMESFDAPRLGAAFSDGNDEDNGAWSDALSREPEQLDFLDALERREAVEDAVHRLPPREKQVMRARFAGKTHKEVGVELGFSRTISWACEAEAKKRMKRRLTKTLEVA